MALLNGKFAPGKTIDPKIHKFIGMFRCPEIPKLAGAYQYTCTCGIPMYSDKTVMEHYISGCFDVPQYVSIRDNK